MLATLATRYAKTPGIHPTPFSGLSVIRADRPMARLYTVQKPALCFVAQGMKEITVGDLVLRYAAGEFLYSSVELPMTGEILQATRAKPYLCLVLTIEPSLVFELVTAADTVERPKPTAGGPAVFTSADPVMTDAFTRLVTCLNNRADAAVLAPTYAREITYRLLRGRYGASVRELGVAGSQTQRIAAVIDRLKRDFAQPLRARELARVAGMSVSSFHAYFKKVTTLSPLQYQKQLRLYEARRLLLDVTTSAAEAGFRVGYQSASQFNREYARYFGRPPIADVKHGARREAA
jgi:AraC-like DNA-binding protein